MDSSPRATFFREMRDGRWRQFRCPQRPTDPRSALDAKSWPRMVLPSHPRTPPHQTHFKNSTYFFEIKSKAISSIKWVQTASSLSEAWCAFQWWKLSKTSAKFPQQSCVRNKIVGQFACHPRMLLSGIHSSFKCFSSIFQVFFKKYPQ